jgi:hypothetical protein
MLPPSSGSKKKPSKKPAEAGSKKRCFLVWLILDPEE